MRAGEEAVIARDIRVLIITLKQISCKIQNRSSKFMMTGFFLIIYSSTYTHVRVQTGHPGILLLQDPFYLYIYNMAGLLIGCKGLMAMQALH